MTNNLVVLTHSLSNKELRCSKCSFLIRHREIYGRVPAKKTRSTHSANYHLSCLIKYPWLIDEEDYNSGLDIVFAKIKDKFEKGGFFPNATDMEITEEIYKNDPVDKSLDTGY